MSSPQVKTYEYDLSKRVESYPGLYGLIVGNFNKGSVNERILLTSQKEADLILGKPKPGSDVAYYLLHSYLTKSKRCWVYRITDGALYGGVKVGAQFNVTLGTGNGTTTVFSGTLPLNRCHPGSVTVWRDKEKVAYDNGTGGLVGAGLNLSGVNTVNYATGAITITFANAVLDTAIIYARWGFTSIPFSAGMENPENYDFSDRLTTQEVLSSGSVYNDTLVPGALIEPTVVVSGIGNATVVIYDGDTAIAYANEFGVLQDTGSYLDNTTTNLVTYSSGKIDFTLDASYTPANALTASYYSRATTAFIVYGDSQGNWADDYQITISKVDPARYSWWLTCYEARTSKTSILSDKYEISKKYQLDGYERQMFMEDRINGNSYFIRTKNNPYLDAQDETLPDYFRYALPHESINHFNVQKTYVPITLSGGTNGSLPSISNYINALDEFNNKEDVTVNVIIDTLGDYSYQAAIAKLCDRDLGGRGDCYGVLFVPFEIEESTTYITDSIEYRNYVLALSTSFCGLYFGHVKIYDTYNDRELWIPPTGFVGAAFSYTADQFEPWYAAAGWNRGVLPVLDLYRKLRLEERDLMYEADINCMKYKPGKGIAIWGQKTLYGTASALDRANVRWLLIVVENSIESYMEDSHMFEINDSYTRASATAAIHAYLKTVQTGRGLYAFDVVCDETNNTADSIDANEMYLDYYLQPTKTAEYIFLRAIITRTGVSFSDVTIVGNSITVSG